MPKLGAVSVTNTGMARSSFGTWRSRWWWPLGAALVAGVDVVLRLPALLTVGALVAVVSAVVATGIAQRATGRLELHPL